MTTSPDSPPAKRHGVKWFVGVLALAGLTLLAAPVGPTVNSLDDITQFASQSPVDAGSAGADYLGARRSADDQLLASAADAEVGEQIFGTGFELELGLIALDEINYPWAQMLPGWTIEFVDARDELFGLTHTREQRIEIFVRPEQTPSQVAHVIAHELGHAVDVTLNDGDERRAWQEARGIEDAEWWPGSGTTDFATGAGDFAESFAVWQAGAQGFRSELGPVPTTDQLQLLADLSNDR